MVDVSGTLVGHLTSLTLCGLRTSDGRNDRKPKHQWHSRAEETCASIQGGILGRRKTLEKEQLCCVSKQTALRELHKNSPYHSLVETMFPLHLTGRPKNQLVNARPEES